LQPPKIALIHATPLAMAPVAEAFDRLWPEAGRMNLLDDSLSQDLALAGALNEAMVARFRTLAEYAKRCGANAILFTCSAFGPAIASVKQTIGLPALNPNEAMFDEALALCRAGTASRDTPACVGLMTTFGPSAAPLIVELEAAARLLNMPLAINSACATGAMAALNAGDAETHDRLIVEHTASLEKCDVLLLGQFSMARAQAMVQDRVRRPVLTSPLSAVTRLKKLLR
jgi:Asp/Glu/hydantoin racemase